jgi:lipopolysaccharide transport system permease protein
MSAAPGIVGAQWDACREVIGLLTRHRQLTFELARRELTERHSGQVLGVAWAIAHPLVLMGIYLFVFAVVFRQKVGGTIEMPLDYPAYLLAGLVPWLAVQDCLSRSTTAITANASLVKQVVFPLEVLPVKIVLTALVPMCVSMTVLAVYVLATQHRLHATWLLLPALILVQVAWMIGLAYVLSIVGAYMRDVRELVQIGALVSMYLTPIVYLPESVPPLFRSLLYANPFSYLVWSWQDALYFGRFEHWWAWIVAVLLGIAFFGLGSLSFRRARHLLGNFV